MLYLLGSDRVGTAPHCPSSLTPPPPAQMLINPLHPQIPRQTMPLAAGLPPSRGFAPCICNLPNFYQ